MGCSTLSEPIVVKVPVVAPPIECPVVDRYYLPIYDLHHGDDPGKVFQAYVESIELQKAEIEKLRILCGGKANVETKSTIRFDEGGKPSQ